jgi:TorA maturation chaperone TorD
MDKTESPKFLVKADVFRLLSRGFSYPSPDNLEEIRSIAEELCEITGKDDPIHDLLECLIPHIEEQPILEEFSRLFLKGTVPVTESHCCGRIQAVPDVSAFYNAFGMKSRPGDTPDSIMYELEFISLLLVKMVIAETDEQYEISQSAYKKFINEHFGDFMNKFGEKLSEKLPTPYYATLLELMYEITMEDYSINEQLQENGNA